MPKTPALYRLNDDGEAEDVVVFCSEACRSWFDPLKAGFIASAECPTAEGEDGEYITGTVCAECGATLD